MNAPSALLRAWRIREPGVGWCIVTFSPPDRDLRLLLAANRAAAFGVAARWVLHDLRSPAQSLTLIADLMADPGTEVEEILRESCGHLARSLDLLSRVLHPSPPAEIGPIAVRDPLGFIADLQQAGRTGVRLELTIDSSVRAAAGIERHLEHALLNLVINATEALRSREDGLIRITARNVGEQVEVVVADNGPGLPPDLAGTLFKYPFTSKADTALAGSGLHVASEVLRLSGASLTYAPDSERGARFVITLPLWRGAAGHPE